MTDQRINDGNAENNRGIDPVAHHRGERGSGQQDVNQDIVEVGEKNAAGPVCLSFPAAR